MFLARGAALKLDMAAYEKQASSDIDALTYRIFLTSPNLFTNIQKA
jgi:hypothetical protein